MAKQDKALSSAESLAKIADWLGSQVNIGQNAPDEPPDFYSQFDYELAHCVDHLRAIARDLTSPQLPVAQMSGDSALKGWQSALQELTEDALAASQPSNAVQDVPVNLHSAIDQACNVIREAGKNEYSTKELNEICDSVRSMFAATVPQVVQAPKIEAWLIERYDANNKLRRRVVLAPLTDDSYLDESAEAIALCRVKDAAPQPVAASPSVVPTYEQLRELVLEGMDIQYNNYGNGVRTHLAFIDWAKKACALLANTAQGKP